MVVRGLSAPQRRLTILRSIKLFSTAGMKFWYLPFVALFLTTVPLVAQGAPRQSARRGRGSQQVITSSRKVAALLKQNDTRALSRYVDANLGLRISPEVYASKDDVKLSRAQVRNLATDKTARTWGTYDGEGGPIRLNWTQYRKNFVWHRDFTRGSRLSVNRPLGGRSTVINNLRQFYPNSTLVEFYLPSTSRDTMDWESLWLVWKQSQGTWRLIGIAHDQWST